MSIRAEQKSDIHLLFEQVGNRSCYVGGVHLETVLGKHKRLAIMFDLVMEVCRTALFQKKPEEIN